MTDRLQAFVQRHGLRDGVLVLTCPSPACAVTVGRGEPALVAGLSAILRSVIKEAAGYRHEDPGDPACDGKSAAPSLRGTILGETLALSVVGGRVLLSEKQRVLLLDFDGTGRPAVHVQFLGT